jgi:hypothetical protein
MDALFWQTQEMTLTKNNHLKWNQLNQRHVMSNILLCKSSNCVELDKKYNRQCLAKVIHGIPLIAEAY